MGQAQRATCRCALALFSAACLSGRPMVSHQMGAHCLVGNWCACGRSCRRSRFTLDEYRFADGCNHQPLDTRYCAGNRAAPYKRACRASASAEHDGTLLFAQRSQKCSGKSRPARTQACRNYGASYRSAQFHRACRATRH